MSLFKVFDVAGSAMNAQSMRMNVTASNLANAGNVSGDPDKVYRARQPVFSSFSTSLADQAGVAGVRLDGVVESSAPLQQRYQPDHPEADADGNVYLLDGQISEIQVFDPEGELLRTIGRQGEGPGEFQNGADMFWAPGGEIGVVFSHRVGSHWEVSPAMKP